MELNYCYWDDFIGAQWTPQEFKDYVEEDNLDRDEDNQYNVRRMARKIVDCTLGRSVGGHKDFWWTDVQHIENLNRAYRNVSTEEIVNGILAEFH